MKMPIKLLLHGVLILLMTCSALAIEIKLPVSSEHAQRDAFQIGLLKLALNKTGVKYHITKSPQTRTQSRIFNDLKRGSEQINLYWMGTSPEYEKALLPIRFPVYRGLLGHRIFIIHKDTQANFDNVKTLSALQKYMGAQGIGWTDIEILEHSGLKQHITTYENIFKMINRGGRVDYFSRGVSEAFMEVDSRKEQLPNLEVEKKILLVYPFAMLFFTSRTNIELKEILEDGFRKAYEDGSFNNYFYNHPDIKKIFEKANLQQRVKINIPNPFLTKETINIPDKYWHGR